MIQRIQAIPPRILMGHAWWSGALRLVIPRLLRREFVQRQAARGIQPMLFGIGDVRLSV